MVSGYTEDQGAVGGAGLEDDMNTLHLDEENEQPPLILETDWAAASHALGGKMEVTEWHLRRGVCSSGAAMGMCDLLEKGIKREIILKQA